METEIKIKIRHQGTITRTAKLERARGSGVQEEAEPLGLSLATDAGVSRSGHSTELFSSVYRRWNTCLYNPATPVLGSTTVGCTCAPNDTRKSGHSSSARHGYKVETAGCSAVINGKPWRVHTVACPTSIKTVWIHTDDMRESHRLHTQQQTTKPDRKNAPL